MPRTRPTGDAIRLDFAPMRRQRRLVEMSQKALAEAAGVHTMTIWRTESGRSEPSLRQMFLIARALGMPIHSLVTVHDAEAPPAP